MKIEFVFRWLQNVQAKECTVLSVAKESIREGARDFLLELKQDHKLNQENEENILSNIIECVQSMQMNLQNGMDFYDEMFKE